MLVKSHAHSKAGWIMQFIVDSVYNVLTHMELSTDKMKIIAPDLYKEHLGQPYYDRLIKSVTSGTVTAFWVTPETIDYQTAIEPHKDAIISNLRTFVGSSDPAHARIFQPWSIRGNFAEEDSALPFNFVHCSDTVAANVRETRIVMSVN